MLEKRPLRKSDVNYACKITNAATEMNSRTGEPGWKQNRTENRTGQGGGRSSTSD